MPKASGASAPSSEEPMPPVGQRDSPTTTSGESEGTRRRADYAALVRQHEGGLLRAARRLCAGNEDRAQDLVQDTFVRGYRAFLEKRFVEGAHTRAWLMRVLTNGFLNDERNRKAWAGVDLYAVTSGGEGGPPATHAPAHERPDTVLMADTLDEPLEQALAALPEGQRACVLLVDVEELTYAEAAEALSVPVGTVRSRLASARLKLHALLSAQARSQGKADS